MKRCGIYVLTHRDSGQKYVGQSIDIDGRWRGHSKGRSGPGLLCYAIAKHGWAAFDASVLEVCARDALNEAEARWISELGSLHPAGYNLTTGGQVYQFTESARAIISEATKRGLASPEVRARCSAGKKGIPKTAEHKAKIGAAARGAVNIAHLAALALRPRSAETREKLAASKRGKKASVETRAKLSVLAKARSGRTHTSETKAKMSAAAMAWRAARREARRQDQL